MLGGHEGCPYGQALTEEGGKHTMMIAGVRWLDDDWRIFEGMSTARTVTNFEVNVLRTFQA